VKRSVSWMPYAPEGATGIYRVFILQAYWRPEHLIGRHWYLPANWRPFIQWSPEQWVSQCYTIDCDLLCFVLCLYDSRESMSNQPARWTPDIYVCIVIVNHCWLLYQLVLSTAYHYRLLFWRPHYEISAQILKLFVIFLSPSKDHPLNKEMAKILNSVDLVRKQIPTERTPLVVEVNANYCG
jgi:hypothetical protein